jgi:hypothetical protein
MVPPILDAQAVRFSLTDVEGLHHITRHAGLDLVEEPHVGRVERVVEVKDPSGDICEVLFCHERKVLRGGQRGKRVMRPRGGAGDIRLAQSG